MPKHTIHVYSAPYHVCTSYLHVYLILYVNWYLGRVFSLRLCDYPTKRPTYL